MPKISIRQKARKLLECHLQTAEEYLLQGYAVDDSDDEGSYDADVDEDSVSSDASVVGTTDAEMFLLSIQDELEYVRANRYVVPRIISKSEINIFLEDLDPNSSYCISARKFKNKYRCTRESLDKITAKIENHPIFMNQRGPKQAPVKHQLMTFLHYMGHEGQTNDQQKDVFRIGSGTCEDHRRRAIKAIRSLKEEYVYWPDEEEREKLAEVYRIKYNCPNGIGHGDGTLIELAFEPQWDDSADYHGRKLQWSLTLLLIGDDDCKIRYYLAGFPGSSHDNIVWRWSKLYRDREAYFSPLQYIIMDTAFEPCHCVVPAIKNNPGAVDHHDNIFFNYTIAKPRVKSEHINGIIKSRFPGVMRKLRKKITNKKKSLKDILHLIDCAVILHNMLIEFGDGQDDEGLEDEWLTQFFQTEVLSDIDDPNRGDPDVERVVSPEEATMNSQLPIESEKDARRTQLKNYIREHAFRRAYDSVTSEDEGMDCLDNDMSSFL